MLGLVGISLTQRVASIALGMVSESVQPWVALEAAGGQGLPQQRQLDR